MSSFHSAAPFNRPVGVMGHITVEAMTSPPNSTERLRKYSKSCQSIVLTR